jgi:HEAT repeat protein
MARTTDVDNDERLRRIYLAKANSDAAYLIGALQDPDHRNTAARFLGELQIRDALTPLVRLLQARDPHARAASAIALGKLGSKDAIPSLLSVAEEDPVAWVRTWAVGALGEIGAPATTKRIANLLNDADWTIRRSALVSLVAMGDASAISPLQSALERESWPRRPRYRRAIRAIRTRTEA